MFHRWECWCSGTCVACSRSLPLRVGVGIGLWLESLPFPPTTRSLLGVDLPLGVPYAKQQCILEGDEEFASQCGQESRAGLGLGRGGSKCSVFLNIYHVLLNRDRQTPGREGGIRCVVFRVGRGSHQCTFGFLQAPHSAGTDDGQVTGRTCGLPPVGPDGFWCLCVFLHMEKWARKHWEDIPGRRKQSSEQRPMHIVAGLE